MMIHFESLQQRINYFFKDESLLKMAFTHRSASHQSYERLEFLGDNILGMIVSEYLYTNYPDLKEGKLSRMRAHLVRSESLLVISQELQLYNYIIVKKFKGIKHQDLPESLLVDLVESLIGAIYIDSDYDQVRELVLYWFSDMFRQLNPDDGFKDSKTALQEFLQSQAKPLPVYEIERIDQNDNERIFHIKCWVESYDLVSYSQGLNKKVAEQIAASEMLKNIKNITKKEQTDKL